MRQSRASSRRMILKRKNMHTAPEKVFICCFFFVDNTEKISRISQ